MNTLAKQFLGCVFVDGYLFTHPNSPMGAADTTRNKVLKQLCENVREALAEEFISQHKITLRIRNPKTKEVESININRSMIYRAKYITDKKKQIWKDKN